MKITIDIPPKIHDALETYAKHNHCSIETIVEHLVNSHFAHYASGRPLTEAEVREVVSNNAIYPYSTKSD